MKTKHDKIAKHIRRLNELLGIVPEEVYSEGTAVSIDLLKALHKAEQRNEGAYVFTTNAVDKAVEGRTEADY